MYIRYPLVASAIFASPAALPATANYGALGYTTSTNALYLFDGSAWQLLGGGGGGGSVTSVGLKTDSTTASIIANTANDVTGSPVTTSGNFTLTFLSQAANKVLAGPTTGAATAPTFRSLVAADIPTGNLTAAGTDGIAVTGGSAAVIGSGTSIAQRVADATHNGYLSSTDWSTFNNKQSALTLGNLTAAGTDGIAVTSGTGAVVGAGTSIAQRVADTTHNGYLSSTDWNTFNGKQAAGNYITALTGDVTASGPGSVAATLATVNLNTGSFGSSTAIPSFTVNGKGLITAASTNAVVAPAGTLTGTTLAANVVSSSLTSVGTITSGTWTGTTIAIANGGTGQTTKTAAFDALSPTTTKGDSITNNGTNNVREAVGSNGQLLTADSTAATGRSWNGAQFLKNLCINSGPDVWQFGTSTTCGPATSTYVCDQWYLKTAGASPFAVTATQQTGTFGKYALKAIVSQASNGSGNAFEMTTVLENRDMLQIYNTSASFSAQIKAFGNVTQVGVQFLTATSEIKPTTVVGSEQTFTVNTSGYTQVTINGQATGTGATTAGVIGVRIRPTAVSSGNIWDLNNGFQMEQAVINQGPVPTQYSRAGATYVDEILLCQRFYCKTFAIDTAPAQNAGSVGCLEGTGQVTNQRFVTNWQFPVEMRSSSPTITTYSTNAASANWSTNGTTPTATVNSVGPRNISIQGNTSVTAGNSYLIQASADARI